MKKRPVDDPVAPRPLDYRKAVRGKYYERMQQGYEVVILAPDALEAFPNSEAVSDSLSPAQEDR